MRSRVGRSGVEHATVVAAADDLHLEQYRVLRPAAGQGSLRFTTETGSHYAVDLEGGTWSRVPTLRSGVLRSEEGPLLALLVDAIGRPAILVGPPIVAGGDARYIITTPLVELDETSAATGVTGRPIVKADECA